MRKLSWSAYALVYVVLVGWAPFSLGLSRALLIDQYTGFPVGWDARALLLVALGLGPLLLAAVADIARFRKDPSGGSAASAKLFRPRSPGAYLRESWIQRPAQLFGIFFLTEAINLYKLGYLFMTPGWMNGSMPPLPTFLVLLMGLVLTFASLAMLLIPAARSVARGQPTRGLLPLLLIELAWLVAIVGVAMLLNINALELFWSNPYLY